MGEKPEEETKDSGFLDHADRRIEAMVARLNHPQARDAEAAVLERARSALEALRQRANERMLTRRNGHLK